MFYSSSAMNFRLRSLLPSVLALAGLILCVSTAPAQKPPAAKPTVAEAVAFIDSAEKELGAMSVDVNRASWVEETYITDDTVALLAEAEDRQIARQTESVSYTHLDVYKRQPFTWEL